MKKRLLGVTGFLAILAAVCVACLTYFDFISNMIFEESSKHLTELYTQVNQSFYTLVSEKWGVMQSWLPYLEDVDEDEKITDFIQEQQRQWGFTEFYFISAEGDYRTSEGKSGYLNLEEQLSRLILNKENVIVDTALFSKPERKVFAVPAKSGTFQGFAYDAIAISYDNNDLVAALNVATFDGEAKGYIVYSDGRVLIDNDGEGKHNIYNFLTYLENRSDMSEKELSALREKLQQGASGVMLFRVEGEAYYLIYNPVNFQDWMMLSVIPASVVNASMNRLQNITLMAFAVMVIILCITMLLIIVRKIRQKLAEKDAEIMYREELFDTLSDNVNDIFIMIDANNMNALYVSSNVSSIMGMSEEEVRTDIRKLSGQEGDFGRKLEHLPGIKSGHRKEWEQEFVNRQTKEPHWFHILAYCIEISGIERYVLVLSDRTHERQLNQTLQNALEVATSANRAKSNFLANMSHDIRTPMNAIIGFSSLLAKDADKPDKVQEYTRKLNFSSRHLLGLINDILDMSKIESGQTTLNSMEFNLSELMEEVYTITLSQSKAKNQKLEFHTQGELPGRVLGDKTRLNQILLNLLSNAVKYTQKGGTISLTLEEMEQKIRGHAHIRFVVADNGYGMSEDFLKIIFEPFEREGSEWTREAQGTGLGMAITKNIVDLMGGTISVQSTPGEGSAFTVELELPVAEGGQEEEFGYPEKGEELREQEYSLSGLHVLAAEDNELNAEILAELLDIEGMTCEVVSNGKEAVERFERSEAGEFDLIFMDIQMPVMDGYEAAKRIRVSAHADAAVIPIIAMTANAFDEDVRKALDAGMNAHASKPVDIEKIKSVIYRIRESERIG